MILLRDSLIGRQVCVESQHPAQQLSTKQALVRWANLFSAGEMCWWWHSNAFALPGAGAAVSEIISQEAASLEILLHYKERKKWKEKRKWFGNWGFWLDTVTVSFLFLQINIVVMLLKMGKTVCPACLVSCWSSRTGPKRYESSSMADPWCLEGVQICFLCDCMKLPVSSHPPGHLLSVHFHMIWFQDSIHGGMWLRNKTPWRAIVRGVMAASEEASGWASLNVWSVQTVDLVR